MRALTSLTIAAFRGLRDLTLTDLGRVNLLVGQNNTGKTSVLEALSLYCNPFDEFGWLHTAQRRELGESRLSRSEALAWLFPRVDGDALINLPKIRIHGDGRYDGGALSAHYKPIEGEGFPRRGKLGRTTVLKGVQLGVEVALPTTEGHRRSFHLWDTEPLTREQSRPVLALPADMVTPMSHRLESAQVQHLTEATIANFKDDTIQLVRHLDPEILDLDVLDPDGSASTIYVHHKTVGHAPLSTFGGGLQRALVYALMIPGVRGGVLLIDELESAIHVSALPQVFTWLVHACEQHDIQLFATTHSLEAVDAVLGASEPHLEHIVGYRLNPPGSRTGVTRLDGELLHGLRHERGLDVR